MALMSNFYSSYLNAGNWDYPSLLVLRMVAFKAAVECFYGRGGSRRCSHTASRLMP